MKTLYFALYNQIVMHLTRFFINKVSTALSLIMFPIATFFHQYSVAKELYFTETHICMYVCMYVNDYKARYQHYIMYV